MIAIPVDYAEDSDAAPVHPISDLFGEAAYFSLYSPRGQFLGTVENPGWGSGQRLSAFLAGQGVTQVVFRHLGDKLFGWLNHAGIEAFAVTDPTLSIDIALRSVRERTLKKVTDANVGRLLHPAGTRKRSHCDGDK